MTDCASELDQVNENSTSYVTVEFFNKDDQLEQPGAASYRIEDYYSNTVMKGDTAFVAVSGTHEITVLETENAILNPNLQKEIRVLTVAGVYGAGDQVIGEFRWEVVNLAYE